MVEDAAPHSWLFVVVAEEAATVAMGEMVGVVVEEVMVTEELVEWAEAVDVASGYAMLALVASFQE